MQFIKFKILNGCCTSQADNQMTILESTTITQAELWDKLYNELNIQKYIPENCSKIILLDKIQDMVFKIGKVRDDRMCGICGITYLFNEPIKISKKNNAPSICSIVKSVIESNPSSIKELNKNYKLPKWFNSVVIPKYPTRLKIQVENEILYNRYITLIKYLNNNFENNITKFQTIELLSIKIQDYDWNCEDWEDKDMYIGSDRLLFEKVYNDFDYIKEKYELPIWIKPVDKSDEYINWLTDYPRKNNEYIQSQNLHLAYSVLIEYLLYLGGNPVDIKHIEKHIDKLFTIKISDYDWYSKWQIPDPNSNELLFKKLK